MAVDKTIHSADLLNNNQAAQYIGVTPGTLEVWRCAKRYNIAYLKIGRLVKYRKADLDNFLNDCRICSETV